MEVIKEKIVFRKKVELFQTQEMSSLMITMAGDGLRKLISSLKEVLA
jgi:hypothetical protein